MQPSTRFVVLLLALLPLPSARAQGPSPADALPADAARPTGPIPSPSFALGPSDVIRVAVWKEPELTQNQVVEPDGKISIPLAGELPVAGLTIPEAEAAIRDKLSAVVHNPRVTVTMVEVHSRQVYITGEISHPGAYPLARSMNLLQLIASAGGLTDFAHRKSIFLLRAGEGKPQQLDYAAIVAGRKQAQNVDLVPGDTVVVP